MDQEDAVADVLKNNEAVSITSSGTGVHDFNSPCLSWTVIIIMSLCVVHFF